MNAGAGRIVAPPEAEGRGMAWRPALLTLGAALGAWALLFAEEIAAAVRVWNESTAYTHCWLVLPIAAWLAWQRRGRLAAITPAPLPLAALLLLPPALAWLAAERMGIMEGRQLTAMAMLWGIVLATLGWPAFRAMMAPLAYLIFLVPFGAFATPALQHITARIVDALLGLTGIPHYVDDLLIEIPAGNFLVAEACAGLRFLIAALAFGALYAFVMFRSPWRRLVVMGLALVVPILANGLRAFGLVMLGHFQGSAAAVDADHVLYGWVFFSIVILLLILAGLPFREDGEPERVPEGGWGGRPVAPATAGAFGLALLAGLLPMAAGPAAAAVLDRAGDTPEAVAPRLATPPGCAALPGGELGCGDHVVTARLLAFPPGVTWRPVAAERRRLSQASDVDTTFSLPPSWQARIWSERPGAVAVAAWLDGAPAGDGLRSRMAQARNSLLGGTGRPVVVALEFRPRPGENLPAAAGLREAMRAFIVAQDQALAAQAAALSRGR
jgi:exosortase A